MNTDTDEERMNGGQLGDRLHTETVLGLDSVM